MSHLTIKTNCIFCSEEFTAKSSKGIYCSSLCFKRNYRRLQKQNTVVGQKVKVAITKENLENKHYLSVKEAVIYFEISETILRRKITENKVNYVCLKNRFLFLKSDLLKILIT